MGKGTGHGPNYRGVESQAPLEHTRLLLCAEFGLNPQIPHIAHSPFVEAWR